MPYVPRAAVAASCAHCGFAFEARHLRRKYCCNSCNVMASEARKKARAAAAAEVVVPAPGPAACPLPRGFRHLVGPTRALGPPCPAHGFHFVDYAIGPEYWLQAHKARDPVNWQIPPGYRWSSREFYVGDDGMVWVPDAAGSHRLRYAHTVGEPLPEFAAWDWQDVDPGPWVHRDEGVPH